MLVKDSTLVEQDSTDLVGLSPLISEENQAVNNFISKEELYTILIAKTEKYGESKVYFEAEKQLPKNDWILGFLIVAFAIIAFVKAFQPKRVRMLISTLTNWKIGKQIIRYEKVHSHPVNIGLSLVFISASSLFLSLCVSEFTPLEYSLLQIWLIIMLGLAIYSLTKVLIYKLSAFLLVEEDIFSEYTFHTLLFAKLVGVICLIGIVLFEYSKLIKSNTAIIITSISAVLFVIQLLRGVQIGRQKTQNLLSIFLYLCTLEILPLILISKWVIGELSRA